MDGLNVLPSLDADRISLIFLFFWEDFKRIIDITYRFSSCWRRVHNPITGHDVADDLTTTEFAIAMLAARGWTTQEIAQRVQPN